MVGITRSQWRHQRLPFAPRPVSRGVRLAHSQGLAFPLTRWWLALKTYSPRSPPKRKPSRMWDRAQSAMCRSRPYPPQCGFTGGERVSAGSCLSLGGSHGGNCRRLGRLAWIFRPFVSHWLPIVKHCTRSTAHLSYVAPSYLHGYWGVLVVRALDQERHERLQVTGWHKAPNHPIGGMCRTAAAGPSQRRQRTHTC